MISFEPMKDATVNIAVSTSSQSILVENFGGANQIRVMNNATATVWITFGGVSDVAATTNDIPIPSGGVEVFSVGAVAAGNVYAAAIAPSGTGSIYFTPGAGI